VNQKRRRKQTEQLRQRDRKGTFDPVHGCTSAPHLESAIGNVATDTVLNAQAGAANQRASIPSSLHTLNPDTFQTIGGLALQSLAHLDTTLPAHFKCWQTSQLEKSQNSEPLLQ
jgi:hypothetical protein